MNKEDHKKIQWLIECALAEGYYAGTLPELMEWLRKKKLNISIETGWEDGHYIYMINFWDDFRDTLLDKVFTEYYDAMVYGILEAYDLLAPRQGG